ncbi:MAG: hypothetical protein CL912_21525 [Deltaproteobacteria bacterium]|nr:hypothetical protein [Deltaproteobacteria bacterium]
MTTGRRPWLDIPTPTAPKIPATCALLTTTSKYLYPASPTRQQTNNRSYWSNINSRTPSIRFGTGHVYNSYFLNVADGINTRDGAQVLVQSNVWAGTLSKPLYSTDDGYAVASDNDFGGKSNAALAGTLTSVPYSYSLLGSGSVKAAVVGSAGATLSF